MSRTTFQNAIRELHALLAATDTTPVTALSNVGVVAVYDHEPRAGDGAAPCYVTVSPAGMSPDYWQIVTRIYVTYGIGASEATDLLLGAMVAVDELMTDGFGPSQWEMFASDELGAMVATNLLTVVRDYDDLPAFGGGFSPDFD